METTVSYYTYGEDVLLFNFVLDFVILFFAQKIITGRYALSRLCFAALLGSVYALFSVLFPHTWGEPYAKLLISFVMGICVLEHKKDVRSCIAVTACIYAMSFFFSGFVLFLFENARALPIKNAVFVLFSVCVVAILLFAGIEAYKSNFRNSAFLYSATLCYKNQQMQVALFLDSGNAVKRIYGKYVIFLQKPVLEALLTDLHTLVSKEYNEIIETIETAPCCDRAKIVFISTAAQLLQPMPAFMLDWVAIESEERVIRNNVLAVMMKDAFPRKKAAGLFNADFIFD